MEALDIPSLHTQTSYDKAFPESDGGDYQRLYGKFFLDLYHFPTPDEADDRAEANDSPWATVGGVMKYFRMSYEEVVFNRSYLNILLLNRSIPSYNYDKDNEKSGKGNGVTRRSDFKNETELFSSLM